MITAQMPSPALVFTARPPRRNSTLAIVIHHFAHDAATPQQVHSWHLAKGWLGIGYNYVVNLSGDVVEGRGLYAVGAHTPNRNATTVGIACQGDYSRPREMPTAQREALLRLISELRAVFGDIPIHGHSDFTATACPGAYFPLREIQRLSSQRKESETMSERIQTIQDAPEWSRPHLQRLIDRRVFADANALNLTEDMIRTFVVVDRMISGALADLKQVRS